MKLTCVLKKYSVILLLQCFCAAVMRKSLEVFDEDQQVARTLSLFPEDRAIPEDAIDSLQVKLARL